MSVEVCRICKNVTKPYERGIGMCRHCYNHWYYQQNKEKIKASAKKWATENPKRRKEIEKAYRDRQTKEQKRKKYKRDYEVMKSNPERYQRFLKRDHEYGRQWKEKNPERFRANQRKSKQRRRAREAGVECTLTDTEWQSILKAHNFKCTYCGRDDVPLTRDHVIPLSKGGPTIASNIVPACIVCNRKKSDRLL